MCTILFIVLFASSECYASKINRFDTTFKEKMNIVYNSDWQNYHLFIDYSINKLKEKPNSLEAILIINNLKRTFVDDHNTNVNDKFRELYNKFSSSLNTDSDTDTVEKLVLAYFLYAYYSNDEITEEETDKNHNIGKEALEYIKNNCKNKDYSALSLLILAIDNSSVNSLNLLESFRQLYPNHSAMPLVDFGLISNKHFFSETSNYSLFIENALLLADKYKNVSAPTGDYSINIFYYDLIVIACIKSNKLEDAQKYYEYMKKEAPDYYLLKKLENCLNISKKH